MNLSKNQVPIKLNFWSLIAVVFPLGLLPKAPGTFGSLAGIPLGLWFYQLGQQFADENGPLKIAFKIGLLLIFCIFTWYAIFRTEKSWNTHDDGRIVIDEVLGQAIPLSFFPMDWPTIGLCFIFFRFFDIIKPGPIGWADRHLPGAWGTLLDDVLAGIFAFMTVWLLKCLSLA